MDSMPIIGDKFVDIINESLKKKRIPWNMEAINNKTVKTKYEIQRNIRPVNMSTTYEKMIDQFSGRIITKIHR